MEPLFTVLRVVNVLPHVQVTWVSVYSGWMFFFMVSSRGFRSPGRLEDVNRNQPSSLPGSTRQAPIGLPATESTVGGRNFFPRHRRCGRLSRCRDRSPT